MAETSPVPGGRRQGFCDRRRAQGRARSLLDSCSIKEPQVSSVYLELGKAEGGISKKVAFSNFFNFFFPLWSIGI